MGGPMGKYEAVVMPIPDIMNLSNRRPYIWELGVVMEEQPTTALT